MRSTKKITARDAGWDARLDSVTPSLKRTARRQLINPRVLSKINASKRNTQGNYIFTHCM